MSSRAKDLFGKELETGDEIVSRLKKRFEGLKGEDRIVQMYPYITGAMTAYYNSLLLQIEMMQGKKIKNKINEYN